MTDKPIPIAQHCVCCRVGFEDADGVARKLCTTCEARGCRRDGEWPRCYEGQPYCPRCGERSHVEPCEVHPGTGTTLYYCDSCGEGQAFDREDADEAMLRRMRPPKT